MPQNGVQLGPPVRRVGISAVATQTVQKDQQRGELWEGRFLLLPSNILHFPQKIETTQDLGQCKFQEKAKLRDTGHFSK